MDWTDIERMLQERVEDVARHLLPNGKKEGLEWVCGDIDGKPGDSMKVNLGGKVGLWSDFAGNGGGKSLLSLWCAVSGQEFKFAIKEAKKFLGVSDDWQSRVGRASGKPAHAAPQESKRSDKGTGNASLKNFKPLTDDCPAFDYLVNERHIAPEVLAVYKIGQTLDGKGIVFPYFNAELDELTEKLQFRPEPSWLKFEVIKRKDGKKIEWTTPAPEKSLFGKNVVLSKQRSVIITEGEKDALSWATYGRQAVSVPFGAKWKGADKSRPSPNREWIDRDYEWLENFETIYICFDADDAGKKAAMDVINEIGPRRCRLVTLPNDPKTGKPCKDANDCLKAGVSG